MSSRINRLIELADGYTSQVTGTVDEIAYELVQEREQRVLADSECREALAKLARVREWAEHHTWHTRRERSMVRRVLSLLSSCPSCGSTDPAHRGVMEVAPGPDGGRAYGRCQNPVHSDPQQDREDTAWCRAESGGYFCDLPEGHWDWHKSRRGDGIYAWPSPEEGIDGCSCGSHLSLSLIDRNCPVHGESVKSESVSAEPAKGTDDD